MTSRHLQYSAIRSPALAYRKDLSRRADEAPFGNSDGAWLELAGLLHHAAILPQDAAVDLFDSAFALADTMVGEDALIAGCRLDSAQRERLPSDAVRIASEQMEDAGALNLARVVVDSARVAPHLRSHELGMLLAHRARLCWRLGELDAAASAYRELERQGNELDDLELRLRAWIGYTALAQQRGNYPEVRRWSQKIIEEGTASRLHNLVGAGEHGLMVAAAVANDFDTAVAHAWNEYECSSAHPVTRADVLHNISTLLLDMGDAHSAAAGYRALFSARAPLRIVLQSIGCFARASGMSNDAAAVRWAASELTALANAREYPYPTALAYMECARGLAAVGESQLAASMRADAIRVATEYGYHEVIHIADAIDVNAATRTPHNTPSLPAKAYSVAEQVRRLAPRHRPEHVLASR